MSRSTRTGAVLLGAALSIPLLTGVASAHVTVDSDKPAVPGGYLTLTFRVPTEKPSNTTALAVTFPADAPFASVATKPKPGWSVAVTKKKLAKPISSDDGSITDAVATVTWTAAAGGGIPPESFDDFELSVGPVPKTAALGFPAVQTYADGSTVSWSEPTPPGGAEPDHPAPVLAVLAAAPGTGAAAASATGAAATASPLSVTSTASTIRTESDGTARGLGVAGIVLGGLGLAAGAGGLRRATRRPAGPAEG